MGPYMNYRPNFSSEDMLLTVYFISHREIVRVVPNHHLQRCIKDKLKCRWRDMQPLQSYKVKLCRCMIRRFDVRFMQSLTVYLISLACIIG